MDYKMVLEVLEENEDEVVDALQEAIIGESLNDNLHYVVTVKENGKIDTFTYVDQFCTARGVNQHFIDTNFFIGVNPVCIDLYDWVCPYGDIREIVSLMSPDQLDEISQFVDASGEIDTKKLLEAYDLNDLWDVLEYFDLVDEMHESVLKSEFKQDIYEEAVRYYDEAIEDINYSIRYEEDDKDDDDEYDKDEDTDYNDYD